MVPHPLTCWALNLLYVFVNLFETSRDRAHKQLEVANAALAMGQEKTESLFLNILPAEVAEELKATGQAEAQEFDHVTILFSDFQNFTGISEHRHRRGEEVPVRRVGDTVNRASRMETDGEVGEVNTSEATYELVKKQSGLTFTPRGKVEAKGKGELDVYFVRSSTAAAGGAAHAPLRSDWPGS